MYLTHFFITKTSNISVIIITFATVLDSTNKTIYYKMVFDIEMIKAVYEKYPERIAAARKVVGKPLTLAEKILYAHLWDGDATEAYSRGASYVDFAPDRVAMQDATAQMALLQFMQAGKKKVAVPSTVHLDHLIQARIGASKDLQEAINKNN